MKWNTRLTELLGCKYPIIEGALTGLGYKNADFAAEVSKTGAVGCITAHSYKTGEKLQEAIRRVRDMTDNPFTVNVTIGMFGDTDELLDACIEAKVPVIETAAFKPDAYADKIKKSGITWIHKAATVDFVLHGERLGADAVVLVGLDGYGFKAAKQMPTLTSIAYAARLVKVPLIAAGGIGDARSMLGAMMAGADGVYIGSGFMATKECPFAETIKQNMVKAKPDHPELIRDLLSPPDPAKLKEMREKRDKVPLNKWLIGMEMTYMKQGEKQAFDPATQKEENYFAGRDSGETPAGRPKGPFSFACGFVDDIPTVQEYVDRMVADAEKIMTDTARRWAL